MKNETRFAKIVRRICFTAGLFALGIWANGCATPQIISTPTPVVSAPQTNPITGAITPPVTNYVVTLTTNYVPNATVTSVTTLASQAVPFVPAPYGEILAGLLAVATTVSTYIAAKKNGQANTANSVASTIIQGVESAGTAAATVKQSVAKMAAANGTSDLVETAVNALTGNG